MAFNLKNITQKIGIDKDQDLLEAARNGKNDVIERMLKKRQSSSSTILSSFLKQGNINCVDREGDTPLHLAALNGHKGSVEILLRENALVNIQDLMGCSPLHLAAWKGYSDICLLLVSNVNEMIQVNLQNNAGETALHNAAQFGYASTVEVLLQHNADPTIRNLKDDSPLDLAARFGRMDVVQCLINKYPELVNSNIMNHSPLHLAAACGHLQIVVILLDAGYKINTKTENGTALHVSALYCKTDIVRLLLERGIDYNEVDKDGLTVLQILQEHEKTQTSYTEIVSIISGFIEEKNNSAKNVDESDSAAAYDTLVVHHPKPKPRPRTSPGSPLYAKPHKDKIKSTEEVTPLADPVTTPTEPPPIPPRLSSIDLPAETSPVHSTIAEAREASLLMENLKPFVSPFSENTAGEEQPVSHNSPPLPPKVSASSRRGVVSMIERASDFKASPKVQSISSAAPWKSEANLLDDSLPPPKPCDADGARTESYLDMGSSVSPGKQKPIKPPRLKKSPTPVRSNVGKKSTEPSANIPQSDGSIKKPEPKEARVTQGATGKTTKSTLAPEDYEIMANVDKKVQGETKEEKHDNYMTAFSVKRTEKVEENSKQTVGENISRKSEGFETKSLSYNPKVEDKVVSVEYENSANIGNIRKDDVVEYQNTKTSQVSTSHNEGAKSESMYIPNDNIPADDNGNILQSDIPKMHNSDEKISFNVSKDAAFADSFTKSSICDINCDRKQGSDDQSFRVESGNHGDRDKQRLSNGSSESHDDSRASVTKPSSLPFEAYATGPMKSLPLSPTLYHQPPTPDHPPPSPHTAMLGIHQKIIIDNKRSSKDIETITEDCLMADDIPKVADSPDDLDNSKTDSQSEREVKVNIEGEEDVVVMRKSRASIGSLDDLVTSDSLRPFEASARDTDCLLRGSVIGKPRKLASQLSDNAHRSVQRKTLQTSNTTIDPVAEEDFNVQKVMAALAMTTQETRSPKLSDDHESEDEWAQIADIVSSFGGDIGVYADFASIEAEIEKLTEESNKIQSVGDWLEEVGLGQYENTLVANGFDDTDFLGEKIMDDQDLELIGVTVADHRKKILDTAKSLPQITPIDPDNPPASVEDWLTSLHLSDYFDTFIAKKMDTMERVLKLWEVELTSVLDISALGHRKRILSSLEKRSTIDRQFPSLKKRSKDHTDNTHVPFKDINLYKDYTKVKPITSSEEDIKESSQNAFPPVDSSEDEDVFRKDSQGKAIRDSTIHLRPPHQAHTASPIKQWRHRPEMLIKGCCNYTAQYLGSTLVKELCGTESTREGITKLKKSSDVIAKIPTIMLSISYKGVKFIDAKSKKVICDHEIGNIFCACQDADSMNFFAYITRDNQTAKHYCHVFNVRNPDMAREIILTLGEAFEVAYQMALKEKAANEAQEFERKLSQSDREDSVSISSKASVNTV